MAIEVLDEAVWTQRREAHVARVDGWLTDHRERRGRGAKHPVEDFLFEYYRFSPSQLRRWHPGYGVTLGGRAAEELLSWRHYVRVDQGVAVDTAAAAARSTSIRWVHDLLVRTAGRPAHFGCFGLHEWAMVYRLPPDQRRHPAWPVRLAPDEIAAVVEERSVRCTHFDAFRFFAPPARRLNLVQPTRASQPELEQSGCLHANMDLYKHAYKLSPLVPSDLVADAFALARDIRGFDMRASPYDLTALGFAPVPIETAAGRAAYSQAQREFSARSVAVRQALIAVLDRVLADTERATD